MGRFPSIVLLLLPIVVVLATLLLATGTRAQTPSATLTPIVVTPSPASSQTSVAAPLQRSPIPPPFDRVTPSAPPLTPPALQPGPPPSQPGNGCGQNGLLAHGGDTIGLSDTQYGLQVTLPGNGTFIHHPGALVPPGAAPPGQPFPTPGPAQGGSLYICSVDNNASVTIDADTARELARDASTPAGVAIVNQILAGARTTRLAPGTDLPVLPGRSTLRPPSTGDAGLLVAGN